MAPKRVNRLRIDIASLPDISKGEVDFHDTSFFWCGDPSLQLPSPASILRQFPRIGRGVAKLEHLDLAVKVGRYSYLRLEEAQTMRELRKMFAKNEVPVPEVFGWRKYGDLNFIYMSLILGPTLRQAWPTLTEKDKLLIRDDLNRIVKGLRRVGQSSSIHFIGIFKYLSNLFDI